MSKTEAERALIEAITFDAPTPKPSSDFSKDIPQIIAKIVRGLPLLSDTEPLHAEFVLRAESYGGTMRWNVTLICPSITIIPESTLVGPWAYSPQRAYEELLESFELLVLRRKQILNKKSGIITRWCADEILSVETSLGAYSGCSHTKHE